MIDERTKKRKKKKKNQDKNGECERGKGTGGT
jgi:hypothetical protein